MNTAEKYGILKIIAVCLVVSMLLACMPVINAQADDGFMISQQEGYPLFEGFAAISAAADGTVVGGDVVTQGGVYDIGRNAGYSQGTITIDTREPVTLIGTGISESDSYDDLYINCAVDGVTLILKDVYIYNTSGATNMIDFKGHGNSLLFDGVNMLDMDTGATGYAMIHVNAETSLTLGGVTDDDTLYLYKREQGAGIGGNGSSLTPEYNGNITITGGKFFMKNSKQGALFGSGAGVGGTATGSPGDIVILGGELNLLPISRGAAIGGSAGSGGGARGADVYVYSGASINFNVDFSGAAIGGGGYDAGNDSDGGVLHYYGGSIRTFIDYNAVDPSGDGSFQTLWPGVTGAGVNDAALTAAKRDGAGVPVYLFVFDTQQLQSPASYFAVKDGGTEIYGGGLHKWSFVNEDLHKDAQVGINYTVDNWAPLHDTNLYLYLTADRHTLTVNGEEFIVVWDNTSKTFNVLEGPGYNISVAAGITGGTITPDKVKAAAGETIKVAVTADENYRYIPGSLKYNGITITQTGGEFSFTTPVEDVILTASFELIPVDTVKHAITIGSTSAGGNVSADKTEAAEGEIVIVTVLPDSGYQLKPSSLKQNGVTITYSSGAYNFLMPDSSVTIVAEFDLIDFEEPNGALFENGKAQDYVLRIDKDFSQYDSAAGVTVDGAKLLSGDHNVGEGSTIVTVNKAYINTLANGTYVVTVYFTDEAKLSRTFTVAAGILFSVSVGQGISGGVIMADKYTASEGETVAVTVTPDPGKRLVTGSLQWDGRVINTDANGRYTFVMPAWDVTLTANFIDDGGGGGGSDPVFGSGDIYAPVWDGRSIDITWFDPSASSYIISTPAQLAGLAALVNGLYNVEIDTVAGNASYIHVNTEFGDDDGPRGNNKSTSTYHFGDYNFAGKTIYLDADIDMGSENYMPVGGQYLMTINDSSTRIDASFCGVFDGQGHSVTLNTNRHCSTGDYGDGQSVGLIGRIGVHDNDSPSLRPSGAAIRNVVVYGSVYANRSVGGIAGKIGKTNGGAVIENCANFASISSTDAKGIGGIVGAAWNGGVIRNCYNAGSVKATHTNPAGGIAGSVEIPIENCYSYGKIEAPPGYAMGIGTNNGGGAYKNSFYLSGSATDGGWFTSGKADNGGERTSEYMKSDDFVADLGNAFAKDTGNINGGYPVFVWQSSGTPAPETVKSDEDGMAAGNLPSETTIENGSATVTIDNIDIPLGADPTTYVIAVDANGGNINDFIVEIPVETVKKVKESGSSLRIESDIGYVFLPNKTLAGMTTGDSEMLRATFKKHDESSYTVSLAVDGKNIASADGGLKLTIPAANASAGSVAVLVKPDGTTEIISKSFSADGNFIIPMSGPGVAMIISNAKTFSDVHFGEWYYDAVAFATARELFLGTSDTGFEPNSPMTRAMLVTVLWRLENSEFGIRNSEFSDVASGQWYTEAVDWASANDIVNGYEDGRFGPGDNITREQLAVILYRYAGYLGMDTNVSADVDMSAFTDLDEVSGWASAAVYWAAANGVIEGTSATTVSPRGTATRAQVATMLMRFIALMP